MVFDPADLSGFTLALSTFAASPEMRRNFGEAGRVYAAQEFDPVRQARLFESILIK